MRKKKIIILLLLVVISLGISKTYDLYNKIKFEKKPNIELAFIVDGEETDEMPTNPKGKGENYYEVGLDCVDIEGENLWDYNAWKLNLDYVKTDSRCTLTFTSTLTEEKYQEYLEAGVQKRRNNYRGKNITEYKSLSSDDKMNLYNQINNCTFDDIYVGDYIESSQTNSDGKKIRWLIADINVYRHKGDDGYRLRDCHAVIIPDVGLKLGRMNKTDTADGGYGRSEMVQITLGMTIEEGKDDILNTYIVPDFKDHIIQYQNVLSNKINETGLNRRGKTSGCSSGYESYYRYLDLMSEVNVFGSKIVSSSGYDVGTDYFQYAIFQLRPDLINTDGNGSPYKYWLKAVAYSTQFAIVEGKGRAYPSNASRNSDVYIRPRFLIG